MGNNCGEQLCGFAAALTNSCFEERQLWGVALESNFGKLLSETSFWGRFSSFGEQLFGAALDNDFGERLWGTALWSSFGEQLCGLALERNFGGQLSAVTLRSSFREPLWRIALGSRLGTGLKHSSFGATALQRCFGVQLWEAASGSCFGKQLWGAALASFPEQLCRTIALKNSSFGEQLSVAILGRSFREPLCRMFWGAVLVNRFAELQLWGNSFGEQLWGIALGSSAGEQLWGAALDSFPDQL